ncbi:hypothetical protein [Bacillus sp. 1P06AnD]|uniref:hypothetical protein n=1 Tax=Bacillus sp. 1P06AnD TaxID=3132208 RepID=UPI0039A0A5E8
MRKYLTSEHYAMAELNGISRKILESRVYHQDWSIERALTQPVQQKRQPGQQNWKKWKHIAEKFGICNSTFNDRIRRGWDEREAASHPIIKGRSKRNAK